MHIAMIGARNVPARHGGLEVAAEQLSLELGRRGHNVSVFVDAAGASTPSETFRVTGVPCIRTKHLHTLSQTACSLPGVRRSRPDIAHFHGVGPAMLAPLSRASGVRTVVTVQGLDWQRAKWRPTASKLFGAGVRATIRRADAVIAVSRTLQRELQRLFGIPSVYIPNGVHLPSMVGSSSLRGLGLDPEGYLLFASRLVPEKGLHILLEAYRQLGCDLPLVIAGSGSGSYATRYERQMREMAPPNVKFVGFRTGSELQQLFANARGYVLPSFMEGLPLSLLEAMSHGRAVVHSAIPECEEVTSGDAGLTFGPGDADDLARQLKRLLLDDSLRQQLGSAARARVQQEYVWETIAAATEELYGAIRRGHADESTPYPSEPKARTRATSAAGAN